MFSSIEYNFLKVKFSVMLILCIILGELVLVLSVPLPMQAVDDIARLGGNAAKNSGKGVGSLDSMDDIAQTTRAIDTSPGSLTSIRNGRFQTDDFARFSEDANPAPGSLRKMKENSVDKFETGDFSRFPEVATVGKEIDSGSSAINGKGLTSLPGNSRPRGKLPFERVVGLIPNKKILDLVSKYKNWSNRVVQFFSKLRQGSRSGLETTRQGLSQFRLKQIAKLFPNKAFKSLISKYENLGKKFVQYFQKSRQSSKVQSERPMIPETQPGQAGKTMAPDTLTQPGQVGNTGRTPPPIDPNNIQLPPTKNFRWSPQLSTIPEETN